MGHRRHRRRGRPADAHENRRVVGEGRCAASADEESAAAAGQMARIGRCRTALSPAVCRSDRHAGIAACVRVAVAHDRLHAAVAGSAAAAIHGSRNADDARDPRRRHGAAVRDASQRARYRSVPARCAGAVSEAPRRRRFRARVRNQPQFPKRRRVDAAQSRIHDARVVSGVCHVQRDHGFDRIADSRNREGDAGQNGVDVGRPRYRCRPGVQALAARRSGTRAQRRDRRGSKCAMSLRCARIARA